MTGQIGYVRADVAAFLARLEHDGNGFAPGDDIVQSRLAFSAMLRANDAPVSPRATPRSFTCPGPAAPIALRLFTVAPEANSVRSSRPVVIFFHGGGFILGDLDSYASLCAEIAVQTGLPVVAVDYRLAPEAPFPAAPDDCEAATRWIAEHASALGLAANGLILMGDSAGGNLAIVTAQALAARPAALPVVLQVPLYPVAGPIGRHESYRAFREGHLLTREALARFHAGYAAPLDDPRHYPLMHEDLHQSPPALVVTAEYDPLRDSGREYAARLQAEGVPCLAIEVPGMIHGFMTLRKAIPSAQSDLETITHAMTNMLERHS